MQAIVAGPSRDMTHPPLPFTKRWDEPFVQLYTGGTTGRPNLWSKTPMNLLGESEYLKSTFAISPDDVLVAAVPPLHIYGILFSVLVPFLAGAQVVKEICSLPREISASLGRNGGTILVGAPPHYHALASVGALDRLFVWLFPPAGGSMKMTRVEFSNNRGFQ